MALVPVIQPPIMKFLTTRKERLIRMEDPRHVTKREKMIFPVAAFLLCCFLAPAALPLLGMLCFGNILKEAVVTERLAVTARTVITSYSIHYTKLYDWYIISFFIQSLHVLFAASRSMWPDF